MNRAAAVTLIDQTIQDFQKFVIATQEIYYKQDAARANEIGAKLHEMKSLVSKQKEVEDANRR